MNSNILILGGTGEAVALAQQLAGRDGVRVTYSLAGRTTQPRLPAVAIRNGGFGGPEGLAAYLAESGVDAVVDATHPFAARMGWNAAQACEATGVRLLRLERPCWVAQAGDNWHEVGHWPEAVAALAGTARRVLLTVGRQELEPFASLTEISFLIRSVEMPDPMPAFAKAELLLARGPFTLDGERALLRAHAIDTLVCKNSGGATDAKLAAARELGVRVVMKRRPPRPLVPVAATGEGIGTMLGL